MRQSVPRGAGDLNLTPASFPHPAANPPSPGRRNWRRPSAIRHPCGYPPNGKFKHPAANIPHTVCIDVLLRWPAMPNRRCQKIGAFLGTFAILMSLVAPTVSQLLLGVHAGVHEHMHHAQRAIEVIHLAHAQRAAHHHGSDPSQLCDACPYCDLIAHSPALHGMPVALRVAPPHAGFPTPVVAIAFRPYTVLTQTQPRAPPTSS